MMDRIDRVIENMREYCDLNDIPFPEVTTDGKVVTLVFEDIVDDNE